MLQTASSDSARNMPIKVISAKQQKGTKHWFPSNWHYEVLNTLETNIGR